MYSLVGEEKLQTSPRKFVVRFLSKIVWGLLNKSTVQLFFCWSVSASLLERGCKPVVRIDGAPRCHHGLLIDVRLLRQPGTVPLGNLFTTCLARRICTI